MYDITVIGRPIVSVLQPSFFFHKTVLI